MLSSQSLKKSGIPRCVPMKYLVVDEASQIEVGDYIPVFFKYESIRKVCFIGDDKQLPPHGQEEITELKSIFELTELRKQAIFLDTQYRMPPQLGDFISTAVYDDGLQSNPLHPVRNTVKACHFIDVIGGKEEFHSKSWMNRLECQAVLEIAKHLETSGKQYRIITPYEAQRGAIEDKLKEEGLHWGDKCFNVDSFQGNEDDYIIISLVRSRDLGFLKNLRRTNVMLTRCRYGMFICSSQAFLLAMGSKSLVGQLLKHVGEDAWLDLKDIEDIRYHQA
jgi:superfamily I DNA and/or RNA helicase